MNQIKYAVIQTLGNQETAIKWFRDKDEATAFGRDYFAKMRPGDGTLTVEGFSMSEDGKTISPQRRIYDGWHF